jgi:hypothetical protein
LLMDRLSQGAAPSSVVRRQAIPVLLQIVVTGRRSARLSLTLATRFQRHALCREQPLRLFQISVSTLSRQVDAGRSILSRPVAHVLWASCRVKSRHVVGCTNGTFIDLSMSFKLEVQQTAVGWASDVHSSASGRTTTSHRADMGGRSDLATITHDNRGGASRSQMR